MLSTTLLTENHWDGPGPWWPIIPLVWIAFVIVLFAVIGRRGRRHHGSYAGEARLAERYAAGEIEESEYRERLAVLREKGR